jgi:hypothetical protein
MNNLFGILVLLAVLFWTMLTAVLIYNYGFQQGFIYLSTCLLIVLGIAAIAAGLIGREP